MHVVGAPRGLLSQREGQLDGVDRLTISDGPLLQPGREWSGERREGDRVCVCVFKIDKLIVKFIWECRGQKMGEDICK